MYDVSGRWEKLFRGLIDCCINLQTRGLLDLLADIVARRGLGLLLVTHDMGVVARLAHHVTVMENGRLVEHCDVNTLFSAPRHPLSQRLLAAHLALYGLEKTP